MTGNLKKLRPYDQPPKTRDPFIPDGIDAAARAFFIFAAIWLIAAAGIAALSYTLIVFSAFAIQTELPVIGVAVSVTPETAGSAAAHLLSWGWLTNAALGAIFFVTPRAAGVPVIGQKEAVLGAATYNVAVTAGLAMLYLPEFAGTGTVTAFPMPVQATALLGLVLAADAFGRTVWKGANWSAPLAWFGMGLLVVVVVALIAMLNSIIGMGEPNDALLDALLTRAMAVFWLLGVPIGALHYVVPRLANGVLYSAQLAVAGFLSWAILGAMSLAGALVHPSVSYAVVTIGNTATILLLVPIMFIVTNLWSTLAGNARVIPARGAHAMAVASLVLLVCAGVLGAVGSLRSVQTELLRSPWWIGLGALALFGFATLASLAVATHAWPRIQRQAWTPGLLTALTLWGALAGAALTALSLMGLTLIGADPFPVLEESGEFIRFGQLAAAGGLGLLALAGLSHAADTYLLAAHGRPVEVAAPGAVPAGASGH